MLCSFDRSSRSLETAVLLIVDIQVWTTDSVVIKCAECQTGSVSYLILGPFSGRMRPVDSTDSLRSATFINLLILN